MATLDFSPLYRSSIGFDQLQALFAHALQRDETGFPPYNIEKVAEDQYRITLAVAGFTADDLEIVCEPRDEPTVSRMDHLLDPAGEPTQCPNATIFVQLKDGRTAEETRMDCIPADGEVLPWPPVPGGRASPPVLQDPVVTRVLEKDFLAGYDPGKARFRTFLRVCLDRFVANDFQAQARVKRSTHCLKIGSSGKQVGTCSINKRERSHGDQRFPDSECRDFFFMSVAPHNKRPLAVAL